MMLRLRSLGIGTDQTLHVSCDLLNDLLPARKHGFLTCLYTGDHKSLKAPPELVADKNTRPTVMVTDLAQIPEMLSAS